MGCLQTNSYSELPETRAILPVDPQNCSPSSFSEANPGSLKNHSFSLSGLRQIHVEPTVGLCRKSAVYGLNGLRPTLRVGALHLKSSTAARSCFCGLFPWAALLRFAFGQKIWHTIFFSSKATFKIFPKLLPKPRGASPSPKSWHVTGHLRRLCVSCC